MESEKPFGLSVIVPTYNRPEEVKNAVRSVATVTPERVEIIVVDDGSVPNAKVQMPMLNSSRVPIRQYAQYRNRGAQAARNLGIRRARFRFVAFLDSDDEFVPTKVDRILEVIANEHVDLVYHGARGMQKYNKLNEFWSNSLSRFVGFRFWLALLNPVVTPTLVVKRRIRLGPPGLRYAEDYAFLLHYCRRGVRARYLAEELSVVERRLGRASSLSSALWNMRKGEFKARQVLLKQRSMVDAFRYLLGSLVGIVRLAADLIRGRYRRARSDGFR